MSPRERHLQTVRQIIDDIDDSIVHLLKSRQDCVDEVLGYKTHPYEVRDLAREAQVLERAKILASAYGLDYTTVMEVFTTILRCSVDYQLTAMDSQPLLFGEENSHTPENDA